MENVSTFELLPSFMFFWSSSCNQINLTKKVTLREGASFLFVLKGENEDENACKFILLFSEAWRNP